MTARERSACSVGAGGSRTASRAIVIAMAEHVRDRNGETFELRPTGTCDDSSWRSLRDIVDRQVSVQGILDDPGNHDAFLRVLEELDPLRGSAALDFATARALVREALASGALELERSEWRPELVCDPTVDPPAPLCELADEDEEEVQATHTFEFELVDGASNPVPNEPYRVELPDGQVVEGRTNAQGAALITGITTAGNCTLSFPRRTEDEWAAA